jgi:orotate phosphoribosyltransferase
MNYRSIRELAQDLLTWELPDDIEAFVGIPRSGLMVANLLSLQRNTPFADLDGFIEGRMLCVGSTKKIDGFMEGFLREPRKVLVVDDSCSSGSEMRRAREKIAAASLQHSVCFAAVYLNPGCEAEVDLFRMLLPQPRVFEWNLMHTKNGAKGCWDIDGVLCRDPSPEENDDGSRYARFISEVPLRIRPTLPLGWIVTSRLEKYRSRTEEWLARNGVTYEHLVMLDLPDKHARQAAGCHASFKARVYRNTSAQLFVESSPTQAAEIARLSGKHVICFETQECISPGAILDAWQASRNIASIMKARAKRRIVLAYNACASIR